VTYGAPICYAYITHSRIPLNRQEKEINNLKLRFVLIPMEQDALYVRMNGRKVDVTESFRTLGQVLGKYKNEIDECSADEDADVPLIRTPLELLPRIISRFNTKSSNTVYDLGCGDGRVIVGTALAAKSAGCDVKCYGLEIRTGVADCTRKIVDDLGVSDIVKIKNADILNGELDELKKADRVYAYLFTDTNMFIARKLERQLPAGAVVVTLDFQMPKPWLPYFLDEDTVQLSIEPHEKFTIHRYVIKK
jgi:SAM-dependent methyltransferase